MPRLKTTRGSGPKKGGKKPAAKKKAPAKAETPKTPSYINIVNQTVRWEVVKMAHKFKGDMEVAKLLLDCYDVIISGCLKWSIDIEKTRIPSMVSDDGWKLLEEIISVMKWKARQPMKKRLLTEWSEEEDDIKVEDGDSDDYVPDGLEEDDEEEEKRSVKTENQGTEQSADGAEHTKLKIKLKAKKDRKSGTKRKHSELSARSGHKVQKKKYPSYPPKGYKKSGRPRKVLEFLNTPDLPKLFECKRCQERSTTLEDFKDHFKTHSDTVIVGNTVQQLSHISVEAIPEIATIFINCPDCNELTSNYGVHQLKHFQKICDLCGKVFQSFSGWRRHLKYHKAMETGEKDHVCDKCGKGFILISALTEHRRLHSKERPHVCDVCGKGFKQKAHLRRHLFIHSDIKPITCKFCGKGFTNNFNMKSHLRSHTGERPFMCNKCGKSFAHNGSLKTHMKSEHNIEVEYVCHSVQEFDDFSIPKKARGRKKSGAENGERFPSTTENKATIVHEKEVQEALMSIAAGMQGQVHHTAEPGGSQPGLASTEVQTHPILKALENANYSKEVREALLSIAAVSSTVDVRTLHGDNTPGTSEEIKKVVAESNITASHYHEAIQDTGEDKAVEQRVHPLAESTTWHGTHAASASMNSSGMLKAQEHVSTPHDIADTQEITSSRSSAHRVIDASDSISTRQGALTLSESDMRSSLRTHRMTDSGLRIYGASLASHLGAHPQGVMNIHMPVSEASRVVCGSHDSIVEESDRASPVVTSRQSAHGVPEKQVSPNSRSVVSTINESDIRAPVRDMSRLAETGLHMQDPPADVNVRAHPQEVMNIHMPISEASRVVEGNHGNNGEADRDSAAFETVEIAIPQITPPQTQENRQLTLL